ncbi:MAG: TraB/VirB10 family protein [Deltaproteobacteria bacterium]|nr:TraB/VirB10 family protein [Deltaproteobacteria bacterium]
MKLLKNFNHRKVVSFIENNRSLVIIVAVTIILGAIYILGKKEDSKVVSYYNHEQPDFTSGRILSSNIDIYQKKDRVISDKLEDMEAKINSLTELLKEQKDDISLLKESKTKTQDESGEPVIPASPQSDTPPGAFDEQPRHFSNEVHDPVPVIQEVPLVRQASPSLPPTEGPVVISFPVKAKTKDGPMGVTLPSGSFVRAKLLTGVEAPEGKALPVLLQADYAFVGPNKAKVDLSGCFLIAKSTGNLSIERVEMQTTKISCVAKSGRMFEREISGFVADSKDNSFAVVGDVNSKQDRVATMAFLSSIVEGIGSAIARSQTSAVPGTNGGSTLAITGDQQSYIAASGASNAASAVTQWYLKHAENLLPTINIGSGQDLWVVVQESVELPNWYFKKSSTTHSEFGFLSKLVD